MSNVYRTVNTFDTRNACSRSCRLVPALDNVFLRSCTRIRYIRGASRACSNAAKTRDPFDPFLSTRACVCVRAASSVKRLLLLFPSFSPFSCLSSRTAADIGEEKETCGFRAGFHFAWLMFREPLSRATASRGAGRGERVGIGKCVWKTRSTAVDLAGVLCFRRDRQDRTIEPVRL